MFARMPHKSVYSPKRTKEPKKERMAMVIENPYLAIRELNNRSFYHFVQYFWDQISTDELILNWHMEYLSKELQRVAERVAKKKPKKYDLIVNIPPGTSKTSLAIVLFPVWCWTRWHWFRFIASSYSGALSLESAELARDLIRSKKFKQVYPELEIKRDKDTKSNYRIVKYENNKHHTKKPLPKQGGNRYSTSVGGTLTGFHGHILLVDDPINPEQAVSEKELQTANRWISQTLSTRKTDKKISTMIVIMQRLHENDPTGFLLSKGKKNIKHICLPGEISNYREQVKPEKLIGFYNKEGLLDPNRMPWEVLKEMEADLGQYGYAGQVGQKPTPPGGGMFKTDMFSIIDHLPPEVNWIRTVRYWDKAGTAKKDNPNAAFTAGVKMLKVQARYSDEPTFIILDVKRGQWSSEVRETIIRATAEADGKDCFIGIEQEPGSGGKESVLNSIRRLSGFSVKADRPTGDKIYRADPYSVQVNYGNVYLLRGDWNKVFIDEHEHFPLGTYKDQVDAAAGAFNMLTGKKEAKVY